MKKITLTLLLALIGMGSISAAPAFRKARYDGFKVLLPKEGSIVMIGNSITDMHAWNDVFKDAKGNYLPVVNRGNSGTYSTEQMENLESYLFNQPAKVFLMIGTNDMATSGGLNLTINQLLGNVANIVKRIHKRCPNTEVYLYPILNNTTGNRVRTTWENYNAKLAEYVVAQRQAGNTWLTFIDFYQDLYAVGKGGAWSYDSLHPTAASYKIWAHAILPYLGEGVTSVYDEIEGDLTGVQHNGGFGGMVGGSATQFSVRPICADDILVFGDDEIKTGEWNELLGSNHVKNRGAGWDKGGNIDRVEKMITATFAKTGARKVCPKACFLYTGTSDCTGSADMAAVKNKYTQLVEKLRTQAPDAKIYLMALHPVGNVHHNERVVELNALMQRLAEANAADNLKFVDTYTDLTEGSKPNANFITGDFLYGRGYVKFAQKMRDALLADFPTDRYTVISDKEAANRVERANQRNAM
ncbi:MAG: hypothetical protein KBT12_04935 [Bacteroidales bacterium]|nr:hypothetical protein [Candidatus Physcousia equi]